MSDHSDADEIKFLREQVRMLAADNDLYKLRVAQLEDKLRSAIAEVSFYEDDVSPPDGVTI